MNYAPGLVQSGVSWSLLVAQGFPRRPRKRNYICTQACLRLVFVFKYHKASIFEQKMLAGFLLVYIGRKPFWTPYAHVSAEMHVELRIGSVYTAHARLPTTHRKHCVAIAGQVAGVVLGEKIAGGGFSASFKSGRGAIEVEVGELRLQKKAAWTELKGLLMGPFNSLLPQGCAQGMFPTSFVRRSCFWFCTPPPRPPPPPPPPPPSLTHNLCHAPSPTHTQLRIHLSYTSFTHNFTYIFVTHVFVSHHLSHTSLSHTIFDTQSFTHIFVTHHLSHTSLSHTIFHTHLCHHTHLRQPPSPSPTYIFVTHIFVNHHLSHTIFVTHHVTGVALGHIHLRFTWQAWHLWHWAGSGGALGWLATSFPGSQAPSSQIRGHARKRNWVVKMAGIGPAGTAIVARSQVLSTELMGMVSFWNYRFYGQVSAVFDPHPSSKHWFAEDRPRKADQLGQLGW